ncbi:uncharacterized protein GGS25DRAFT_517343 [Hypoxylon fragiforme]|uniref:uncharacterized protein n=1 Tax=Hypoxylon fragiforme TaxID=63214 RepID=UPI0020C669B5|nr:uncharacterized protein GGS25DRAFT_517343 [Hypoxylon fragiforme]KAI2614492.1 hypothetical protein GGS25DRAFT_517343 [Hypoxylon fragiforme]
MQFKNIIFSLLAVGVVAEVPPAKCNNDVDQKNSDKCIWGDGKTGGVYDCKGDPQCESQHAQGCADANHCTLMHG